MHYFATESGSVWTVREGRISREGGDYLGIEIQAEPFVWVVRPVQGKQACIRIKRTGEVVHTGYVAEFGGRASSGGIHWFGSLNPFQGDYHDFLVRLAQDSHADEIRDAMAGHP